MARGNDITQAHILEALCTTFPELQRSRWRHAAVQAFADNVGDDGMPGELRETIEALRLEPDAFEIVAEPRQLIFFEVEVYSPMSDDKLRAFAKFAVDLDSHGVTFELYAVNKHGHINAVDLLGHYAGMLRRASPLGYTPSAAHKRCQDEWVAAIRALQS